MNFKTNYNYTVYDMMTYFSEQPDDIECCPNCNTFLVKYVIDPTRGVSDYVKKYSGLISAHRFTHLFICPPCKWWGIRERFGVYECYHDYDYFISGATNESLIWTEIKVHEELPWHRALEDETIIDNIFPLPEDLGKLFVGGQKIQ